VVDLTSLAVRQHNCELELTLNRRLAAPTYLSVEPLTVAGDGQFAVGGPGKPVEWLVKMVQLPAGRMMDQLIRQHAIGPEDLEPLVSKLVHFDNQAPLADGDEPGFHARLAEQLRQARGELLQADYGIDTDLVSRVADRALRYTDQRHDRFDERVAQGRVRELHGDLRPEHVCLLPDPQIIDCLEFDRRLRTLDTAQEMAFLAMECSVLGDDTLTRPLLQRYQQVSGDSVPADLLVFYLGERALVRAMLAARHLAEPAVPNVRRWAGVADRYLRMAAGYLDQIPQPPQTGAGRP
jgi:aminoglycoside phosphotransferase family enzyme